MSLTYHKIHSPFKRERINGGKLIMGDWALPEFRYLQDCQWNFTEKIDGTNIRMGLTEDNKWFFGGRTNRAQIPDHLLQRLEYIRTEGGLEEKLRKKFPEGNVTLFGEGYGHKINGGGQYFPDAPMKTIMCDFITFDINVGGWWMKPDIMRVISKELDLTPVPSIMSGSLCHGIHTVQMGFKSQLSPEIFAEGLIGLPEVPLRTRRGDRIIIKIKHKDLYLGEHG